MSIEREALFSRAAYLLPLPLDEHLNLSQQIVHLGLGRVLVHGAQRQSAVEREKVEFLHLHLHTSTEGSG